MFFGNKTKQLQGVMIGPQEVQMSMEEFLGRFRIIPSIRQKLGNLQGSALNWN